LAKREGGQALLPWPPQVFKANPLSPKSFRRRREGAEESVSAGEELTYSLPLYSPQKEA